MLLAIDTSSLVSGVALLENNILLGESLVQTSLTHSEQLIFHIDELLKRANRNKKDITALGVARGPGSFTGLRIGLATAKTISWALQIPLVGINTLQALMSNYEGSETLLCSMIDAQKGNVYWSFGSWHKGVLNLRQSNQVSSLNNVLEFLHLQKETVICLGEGAQLYYNEIQDAGGNVYLAPATKIISRAGSIANIAAVKISQGIINNPLELMPEYIRRSEAEVLWEQRQKL